MPKRLVASLLFVSSTQVAASAIPELRQEDMRKADVVVAWLHAHGAKADKKRAAEFFRQGMIAKKQKRWGPAGKAFGESALDYPGPAALSEYALARHIMLGPVRARENASDEVILSDMRDFIASYETALAADAVVHELTPADKERIRSDMTCVRAYLVSRRQEQGCRPVRYFGETP